MIPALKWFENYEPWKNINYHKRNLVPLKNGYTLKVDKMERLIRSK